jgi:putative transposase
VIIRDGTVSLYSADYLRKLYKAYEKYGPAAFADRLANCGHRSSILRPEEQSLLMETIRSSYLTLERKTLKITVSDVRRAFAKENAQRSANGQSLMRVPGRDIVRNAIRKISRLRVMIARYGREHAMKKLRPVGSGLEVLRPGQRVEMDEWCIDLQSIIYSAKLHRYFGKEFLESVGLDNAKARWWLVLAIDCRTRVILGMKLVRNPTTSAAQECLRMIMSDKGAWSDTAGALSGWSQALKPEVLVTDNGPAFKSEIFTNCCLDLRVTILRTIAGVPGMRGTVERMFHTAGLDLMPRLKGRTFSNPLEKGNYKSEDRACLDAEDLALVLVRWVVDIYHNTEHEGLGGRTPLQQWEADIDSGNYPVSALPDTAKKRLAFGRTDRRKLSREGIVVMGVHYHCQELAMHFLGSDSNQLDIRWDMEDIGAISVFLDGRWCTVPAVHDRFKGMNFHVWHKARRALRSKSASRKVWDEETVFRAIDQIEELVEDRSLAFGIIDTSMTDKQFKRIEGDFFGSFRIGNTPQLQSSCTELGREISPRAPDPEMSPSSSAAPKKRKIATRSQDVETMEKPEIVESSAPVQARTQKQSHPVSRLWRPLKPKEDGQ